MLAIFTLQEPIPIVIASAAVFAVAAFLRLARRDTQRSAAPAVQAPESHAGVRAPGAAISQGVSSVRSWIAAATGVAGLVFGAALAVAGTQAAQALLLALGVLAGVALCVELYRRERSRLPFENALLCAAARALSWLVVLLLIGQPRWEWTVADWEKPLLAVLLDESKSMAIADPQASAERPRAEIVNAAIGESGDLIRQIADLYEVQVFGVGEGCEVLDRWEIEPRAPLSAIAAGLRHAGQSRSVTGAPAAIVLLVSDGAETAADARVVREAAADLAARRTALLTVGVGPAPELTPSVSVDPLTVPGRIGSRDRLRVPIEARVTGCADRSVRAAVLWDDAQVAERVLAIERPIQRVTSNFELDPPGVGLHRLTARVALPADLGGESFETSLVIDVSDDQIRVLLVGEQPSSELAFACRALASDPRFEVKQHLLFGEDSAARPERRSVDIRWSDYHVVLFGIVPERCLSLGALAELGDAVRQRGVGLLMAGGRSFYHSEYYARSELGDVCPVQFGAQGADDDYRPRLLPVPAAVRHPVLMGVGVSAKPSGKTPEPGGIWRKLPPLAGAAHLGAPKPLATVLATDDAGQPLLVALDVGRGRTIAAAWESIWPWALASDEGRALHGELWQHMVIWLANRRFVAWVVTDGSIYPEAALAGERQRIQVRAGLSGGETPIQTGQYAGSEVHLTLRHVRETAAGQGEAMAQAAGVTSQPTTPPGGLAWDVPLSRQGSEWRAELPRDLPTGARLASGAYELAFVFEPTTSAGPQTSASTEYAVGSTPTSLTARTGFAVTVVDPELLEPTANLALLQEAASRTSEFGGAYFPMGRWSDALARLAEDDRRQRVERRAEYELVRQEPLLLLVLIVMTLATEWIVRKRGGLA